MLEEQGVVVAIDGERCIVELRVSESCGSCRASCAIDLDARVRHLSAPIPDCLDVQPGDRVVIAIAERKTLLAMCALYLGPLLALFSGAFIGLLVKHSLWLESGDIAALGGASVAFVSYLVTMKKWGVIDSLAATPVIRRRIET